MNVGLTYSSSGIFMYRKAQENIYVPESARSCSHHLDEDGCVLTILLPGLRSTNRPYIIEGPQLQILLEQLRSKVNNSWQNKDENSFTYEDFRSLAPVTREQFQELYGFCDPVSEDGFERHIKKKDLLVFLCKLKQGLSDEFLKVIFKYSTRQAVSQAISTVRKSLMLRFVPQNLGLSSITRDEFIARHVTPFANTLYNPEPDLPKAIVCIDGTYSYIPKSKNFRILRQTYCIHKGRHLVKPALIVAPDGYILEIQGPYFSDSRNNDAEILRHEYEADGNLMREWFRDGDIFILDRGYRDITPLLDNIGIHFEMPINLPRGQTQLTTEEANKSRLVTKSRWIVESRNGHVKSMFQFFSKLVNMHHVKNIEDFYRIAGAIINKYHPLISMEGADEPSARELLEKSQMPNVVQVRVEVDRLHLRNGRWVALNQRQVPQFPRLSIDYLRKITIGVYQVNLAPSYIQDKLQREHQEMFQLDELFEEPGFLRVRVYSRFRNHAKYQLWIVYKFQNEENEEVIEGYYCTCKSGARTLGCCAHVASVLWFLGYARHDQNIRYPSTNLLNDIHDAADRNPQLHPNDVFIVE